MRNILLLFLALAAGMTSFAVPKNEQLPDWQNPQVVERNRVPMSATFETDGARLTLNGVWKFQW